MTRGEEPPTCPTEMKQELLNWSAGLTVGQLRVAVSSAVARMSRAAASAVSLWSSVAGVLQAQEAQRKGTMLTLSKLQQPHTSPILPSSTIDTDAPANLPRAEDVPLPADDDDDL